MLEAREYLDSFETLSGYRDALESFRAGGEWKQGSVYLYVGTTDGVVVFHAVDPDLEGRNLYDLEDSNEVASYQATALISLTGWISNSWYRRLSCALSVAVIPTRYQLSAARINVAWTSLRPLFSVKKRGIVLVRGPLQTSLRSIERSMGAIRSPGRPGRS